MSAEGTRVAIGAPNNDENGNGSGHVRIYDWNGTAWTQLGADIDGEATLDQSGSTVAMSAGGTHVAIGAPNNDGNGATSGHVRIYESPAAPMPWTFVDAVESGHIYQSVDYGGHVFIAISSNAEPKVIRSADGGQTWTGISSTEDNPWMEVAYGDGVWVAVAHSGTNRVMRSTDGGLNWTAVADPDAASGA